MSEIVVFVPFPYKYRSAYLNLCAMPCQDDDAILVCIKSNKTKSGEKWLKNTTIKKDESAVEADVNATVYIQMKDQNTQVAKFIANIDPMFDQFPQWLLNRAIQLIALLFLD